MVFLMENKNENREKALNKASASMQRTAETVSDTIIAVLDKLAGKQSDLKLSFEQLTLDTGIMKATVNGAIVLDVVMAKEVQA
jgi:endonuclease IV